MSPGMLLDLREIALALSELGRRLVSEPDSGFVGESRANLPLPVVGRSGARNGRVADQPHLEEI